MYYSEIPTKLDRKSMTKDVWVKARTQELYDMLPLTSLEERNAHTEIRDEIIEINYAFFGYVAKEAYVTDPLVTFEDKLQSALTNFCQMWAKYKFTPKYRADLSFAVFFRPRLLECIKREFNTIKYSLRRTICIKAGKQLGKPWTEVTKDDIPNVSLPYQEMQVLEAIFNSQYDTPFEDSENKLKSSIQEFSCPNNLDKIYTENYDNLEDLIVHEMIEQECILDDVKILKMAELYGIPFEELKKAQPIGEEKLRKNLEESIAIQETFESDIGYRNCDESDE